MFDLCGNVVMWNVGVVCIKGYDVVEIVGYYFLLFYLIDVIVVGWLLQGFVLVVVYGYFQDEGWCVCKDGMQFWVNVMIMLVYDVMYELCGFIKIMCDMIECKWFEEFEVLMQWFSVFIVMFVYELCNYFVLLCNLVGVLQSLFDLLFVFVQCCDVVYCQVG